LGEALRFWLIGIKQPLSPDERVTVHEVSRYDPRTAACYVKVDSSDDPGSITLYYGRTRNVFAVADKTADGEEYGAVEPDSASRLSATLGHSVYLRAKAFIDSHMRDEAP
jgi:hypothetical protein